MGKFCRQCGAPVAPGNRFCDECGTPTGEAPPVASPPLPPPVPEAPIPQAPVAAVPQPAPGARPVPVPYIIVAVVAVIAIIAAVVLLPGLLAGQPGKGTVKGTTTGITPKYIVGDVVKEADGTLYMVLGIHRASGLYAYNIINSKSPGTYYAFDTLWLNWMDKPFDKFEAQYSKVDHQDPGKVVIERMHDPSTNPPKYVVGDIVMSTTDLTSGYLSIILEVDKGKNLYTDKLVYKEDNGTYSMLYDEWRRPSYTNFQVYESIYTKKVGNVDPKKVLKQYYSTELPITQ